MTEIDKYWDMNEKHGLFSEFSILITMEFNTKTTAIGLSPGPSSVIRGFIKVYNKLKALNILKIKVGMVSLVAVTVSFFYLGLIPSVLYIKNSCE